MLKSEIMKSLLGNDKIPCEFKQSRGWQHRPIRGGAYDIPNGNLSMLGSNNSVAQAACFTSSSVMGGTTHKGSGAR